MYNLKTECKASQCATFGRMKHLYSVLLQQLAFLWGSVVYADYTVTVDLKSYVNPTHMRAQSNDCCDSSCNPCDNRFRFCFSDSVDLVEYSVIFEERPEELVIGCQIVTDLVEINNDNITFGSKFGNTRNPLKFRGDIWPGIAYLLVIVIDVDTQSLDDIVDGIVIPIHPQSLRRFSSAEVYRGLGEYGHLKARYRVDCDSSYFGEDCSRFCAQRNDADGHYKCDRNGNKVCLEGYRDPTTNCTQCVTATGCSPVGGYCNVPGECICRPGFTGDNCTQDSHCSEETEARTTSSNSKTTVYVLGAFVGVLSILLLLLILLIVIILITCYRKRGKISSSDIRSSRGYYVNEGLGPAMASIDIDTESDRSYATVSPTHRLASTVNQVAHNVLSESSSNSTTASTTVTDVPQSSLRANIAYGLEQRRNERKIVNGIRAPMRPPPRPPR